MPRVPGRHRASLVVSISLVILAGCTAGGSVAAPTATGFQPAATSSWTPVPASQAPATHPPSPAATSTAALPRISLDGDLPAGWDISAETNILSLATATDGPGMTIDVLPNRQLSAESCALAAEPGAGATAVAIVEAIDGRRGLLVTEPLPVEVGGLPGLQVDVRIDPTVGVACPGEEGGFTPLVGAMESYGWGFVGVGPDERVRLIAIDVSGGQNVVVFIAGATAAAFDAAIDDATSIVQALVIDVPA